MFVDEAEVHLNPPLTKVWAKTGEPAPVPAAGRDEKAVVMGAWGFRTENFIWHISDRKNTDAFLDLLEKILSYKPAGRRIKLVMDNAPYHRSNKTEEFLGDERNQLEPFWLPPYSPELNLIERVWHYLKEKVTNNYFFGTFDRLMRATRTACRQLASGTDKVIDIHFKTLGYLSKAA